MIHSVKKSLDILTILSANAEKPLTLNELSELAGINKSTCSHILDTMCEAMYVERVSRKDGYRLGPWSYMLSRYGTYRQSLINISSPIVKWLKEQTDSTVFLSVLCNGRKYIIYHIDSDNILPRSDGSMIQGNTSATATGQLLLAFQDSCTLRHALRLQMDELSDLSSQQLEQRFQEIRRNQYAHCTGEADSTESYAFRITDGNKTVASLGVLYNKFKDNPQFRWQVISAGKTAAAEISRRLAFK